MLWRELCVCSHVLIAPWLRLSGISILFCRRGAVFSCRVPWLALRFRPAYYHWGLFPTGGDRFLAVGACLFTLRFARLHTLNAPAVTFV